MSRFDIFPTGNQFVVHGSLDGDAILVLQQGKVSNLIDAVISNNGLELNECCRFCFVVLYYVPG